MSTTTHEIGLYPMAYIANGDACMCADEEGLQPDFYDVLVVPRNGDGFISDPPIEFDDLTELDAEIAFSVLRRMFPSADYLDLRN